MAQGAVTVCRLGADGCTDYVRASSAAERLQAIDATARYGEQRAEVARVEIIGSRMLAIDDAEHAAFRDERHCNFGKPLRVIQNVSGIEASIRHQLGGSDQRASAHYALAKLETYRTVEQAFGDTLRPPRGALHQRVAVDFAEIDHAVVQRQLTPGKLAERPRNLMGIDARVQSPVEPCAYRG